MGHVQIRIFDEKGHGRPFGYFIERNSNKNLTSLKIRYKKYEKGYIFGSVDFENICLFSLIMSKKQKKEIENNYYLIEDMTNAKEIYDKVLNNLIKKTNVNQENKLPFNMEMENDEDSEECKIIDVITDN